MRSLFNFASRDLAIDLGTANTVVYVRGQGIVQAGRRGIAERAFVEQGTAAEDRPVPQVEAERAGLGVDAKLLAQGGSFAQASALARQGVEDGPAAELHL